MKVIHFSFEDAHLYGDALPALLRLRHKLFIEQEGYLVGSYRGMEYDEYDDPITRYTLVRSDEGAAVACARYRPTTERFMIEDLWPVPTPIGPGVWELSRFGAVSREARDVLLTALFEYAKMHEITTVLFVSPIELIQPMIPGIPILQLGGSVCQIEVPR